MSKKKKVIKEEPFDYDFERPPCTIFQHDPDEVKGFSENRDFLTSDEEKEWQEMGGHYGHNI